jgi:flagellar biosynthetic protein FliP
MDFCFLLGQADLSNSFEELAPPLQIALFLGAMSFATAALVSLTAFTRIIIVLSFVRRALSTQEIPPNQVVMGLAFFLTLFVMAPTLEQINTKGIQPYLEAQKTEETKSDFQLNDLWQVASHEIRQFMTVHTRGDDLQLFVDLSQTPQPSEASEVPLKVLIPAFVISELKTAFIMGFCIYIPFLLIDLVISTVLMSLGMMMMPPVIVSTPCKLLLFVLVDGWQLISKALVSSFVV